MKKNNIAIYVILVLVAGGIFYYFSQESQENADQGPVAVPDSVISTDRPTITAQADTDSVPKPVGEDYAPGTALIRATIDSMEYVDDNISRIYVIVNEVLGYGSATPVIASDTDLTIHAENFLKANPDEQNIMQEGAEIRALLSHQKTMAIGESGDSNRWTLKDLKQ